MFRKHVVIEAQSLQQLFDQLIEKEYKVVGPSVRDNAILYCELTSINDLPKGWTDEQDNGSYRLIKRTDEALFGFVVGPNSPKSFLHVPELRLWKAEKKENDFNFVTENEKVPKLALLGVRACELHAMAIQDKVFLNGEHIDPSYKERRENLFIVAVNCGQAGKTCFCVSMQTGPKATFGFDLALTEILENKRHYFLVEIGTESGAEIIRKVLHKEAQKEEREAADCAMEKTTTQMGRTLDCTDIKNLLYSSHKHPRWDNVAARCLTCANCTMVCPTCFCTTVEDVTDLTGKQAERWRKWDSCFTMDFTYIHGGVVRSSSKARYRQWMTHKLASWIDQFDVSGCVGCGRCITWCPAAIDITEEVRAIRE